MFRYTFVALLLSLTFGFASAQEITEVAPTPEVEVTPEVTAEPVAVVIVEDESTTLGTLPDATETEEDYANTLTAISTFTPIAIAIVFGITMALKPILTGVPSSTIKLVVTIAVWGGYFASQYFGGAAQFQSLLSTVLQILSLFVTIPLTGAGASALHSQSVKNGIPFLGYQRTSPPL